MVVVLPQWLADLRRSHVVEPARSDPRSTVGTILGVDPETAMTVLAGGGQADFDTSRAGYTPQDRALLYAYYLQKGHLEELTSAFGQLFGSRSIDDPIVVDLGCGPFTGGLALAGALPPGSQYDYIGVDRSWAMRELGERLASTGELPCEIRRHWASDVQSVSWNRPPGWRPVIVIVSYLLASPTLDVVGLFRDLETLLTRLGRGPVTVLYTNSPREAANARFPSFRAALREAGFELFADDTGAIEIERWGGARARSLRYALFHRSRQDTLHLGGD